MQLFYPQVYIAGPFFNARQNEILEAVKDILERQKLNYFSPKDDCMYEPGVTTPQQILDSNIKALEKADLVIVVTDVKDPGTMFEAGWCYANKKDMIYIWLDRPEGAKFNLMLAPTGSVVDSYTGLQDALNEQQATGKMQPIYGKEANYE